MPYSSTIPLLLLPLALLAQPQSPTDTALLREIDRQVWTPFKAAYEAYDAETFNALHTDDVLRGGPWGLRIGEDQKAAIRRSFGQPDPPRVIIDLRFEHRVATSGHAYEVGIYRVRRFPKGGDPQSFFGQFQVRLVKEEGTWKIAQDWDAGAVNGRPVTAADFDRLGPPH